MISLITLKYTQSNSVCYVKDGQAIGVGAGQQSRIHCTRLAGQKADNWWLRQHEKVLNLPFVDKIGRPDRDNTIDVYISDEADEVLAEGRWQQFFTDPSRAPDPGGKARLAGSAHRRVPGQRCLLPLWGQHRARPSQRRAAMWRSPAVPSGMIT